MMARCVVPSVAFVSPTPRTGMDDVEAEMMAGGCKWTSSVTVASRHDDDPFLKLKNKVEFLHWTSGKGAKNTSERESTGRSIPPGMSPKARGAVPWVSRRPRNTTDRQSKHTRQGPDWRLVLQWTASDAAFKPQCAAAKT